MNKNLLDNVTETNEEHTVRLDYRKELKINGIKELDSFDSEEFLMETTEGYLIVRGQALQLQNLNVNDGVVHITGKIYELTYVDEQREEGAKGFFGKLFK